MARVKRRLPTAAMLLTACVFFLSAPAALAQNAGDEQYSDPLAGTHSSPKTHSSSSNTSSTTSSSSTTQTGPTASAAPPVDLPSSTNSSSNSSSSSSSTLPRTGLDERTLVALGAVLVLIGVALRVRTTRVRRR
jgi:uncharacterized surface anchored protein